MDGMAKLVQNIQDTWKTIQVKHPDVPDVMVTIAGSSTVHGHFWAERWVAKDHRIHELFISGEGLERGAKPVLGTILHEAAHGVAQARNVKDTSRQGRYHNRVFKDLATELGIHVERQGGFGWSATTVPDETASVWADQIDALDHAIIAYRDGLYGGNTGSGRSSSNNGSALTCGCGRKIRASKTVAEGGPILCGLCREPFKAQGD